MSKQIEKIREAKTLLEKHRIGKTWANPTVEQVYKLLCEIETIEETRKS